MKRWSLRALPALAAAIATLCAPHTVHAATERVVYSFATAQSGSLPQGALINLGKRLFGTTSAGGDGKCGTIFSLTVSGTERILHACENDSGGTNFAAGLTDLDGTLYGASPNGGVPNKAGYGTIFSVTPNRTYTRLHAFDISDGANPSGKLTALHGMLYGMTTSGGTNGCGTVFAVTSQGAFTSVHSFVGTDGCYPVGGLTAIGNTLYGVTMYGGTGFRGRAATGHGVVFALVPGGTFSILHDFHSRKEGALPTGDLLAIGNNLFGTTASGKGDHQGGTAFRLNLDGTYKLLHVFGPDEGADGRTPNGGLILLHGLIYGTTQLGGGTGNPGTVFSLTRTGTEAIIHSFQPTQGDGQTPAAGLHAAGGMLFGTTYTGGSGTQCSFTQGCGTVFEITPE